MRKYFGAAAVASFLALYWLVGQLEQGAPLWIASFLVPALAVFGWSASKFKD